MRSRSMSPVEMWGTPRHSVSIFAWVPLPDPGDPNRTMAITKSERAAPPADTPRPRREPLVVPHDQLRFHLVDRIHGDADDNQQRCAAEIEIDSEAVQNLGRQNFFEPQA